MNQRIHRRSMIFIAWALVLAAARSGAGAQGEEVYARSLEARAALRAQDWSRAADLYRQAVEVSSDDGMLWDAYGVSLLHLQRWDEARTAFTNCVRVGFRVPVSYYNLACAASRAGRIDEAIADLRQAYEAGYIDDDLVRRDQDLDPLRADPRFRDLTGVPDPAVTDRVEQWRRDLAYLVRRLEQVHYDLYANISPQDLHAAVESLAKSLDTLDDLHVRYEIQKILVRIGDGHTAISLPRFRYRHGDTRLANPHGEPGNDPPRVIPIDLVWYDEGVFVRGVQPASAQILGGHVVAIDSIPMDEALRRVDAIVSRDNEWGARWMAMEYLRTPDALQALGLADRPDAAVLTVETPDGARETITLAAEPVPALDALLFAPSMIEGAVAAARPTSAPYRFEVLQDPRLAWVEIDEIRNGTGESLADFTSRLMRAVDEDAIEYMAIDLRRNHGGSGSLMPPLLHAIIGSPRVNRPDHLFVLVSRETFSAAMAFAADLDLHTAALFVGEPTGSRPNFVGESSVFALPYSQTIVSCSSLFHQNGHPTDTRRWIAPDLPVPRTPAELRTSEDLGRSTILRRIATLP